MHRMFVVFLMVVLAGCASAPRPIEEGPPNPYAKNYISLMAAPARASSSPAIYRGQDRDADQVHLLERGYDMLGYSAFEAGSVPPELLNAQADKLHADLALVYTEKAGGVPDSVKLDQAKARAQHPEGAPSGQLYHFDGDAYRYFASYWVKLPRPLLGVHVLRLRAMQKGEPGLQVIAVVHDSPAEQAGIQRGDTLLRLGDVALDKPELLVQAAKRYAGQSTELVFNRMGGEQHQRVTLNTPQ